MVIPVPVGVQEGILRNVGCSAVEVVKEGRPGSMFEGGFFQKEDFVTRIREFEQDEGVSLGFADVEEEVWFDVDASRVRVRCWF